MDMSSFSTRTLQEAAALLSVLSAHQVATVAEAIDILSTAIAAAGPQVANTHPASGGEVIACPSCAKGHLQRAPLSSSLAGVAIWVCSHRCGYSTMVRP